MNCSAAQLVRLAGCRELPALYQPAGFSLSVRASRRPYLEKPVLNTLERRVREGQVARDLGVHGELARWAVDAKFSNFLAGSFSAVSKRILQEKMRLA